MQVMQKLPIFARLFHTRICSTKLKAVPTKFLTTFSPNPRFFQIPTKTMATETTTTNQENNNTFQRPFLFRQLFDRESCTYTYLLGDPESREALLIDPVYQLAERDAGLVKDLDLNLVHVMNTHVHADHVTGTGKLKGLVHGTTSVISEAAGAEADKHVKDGQRIEFGQFALEVRSTPGHTNGCVCYVFHEGRMVFTGDTLLIRGCGRTDFQEGCSQRLYESVHNQLFTLPEDYLVYPAHDYKGLTCSSIGEEKKFNPRLTKPLTGFIEIMSNLGLPYPKMLDIAVPANRVCGLYNLPEEWLEKEKEKKAA